MPKTKTRSRSRNYCFTEFNLTNDYGVVFEHQKDIIRYLCYGQETCPKTKKQHYQGCVQFHKPQDFNAVKKILPPGVHFEKCKGNEIHNEKYCRKEGEFHEWGKFVSQGYRSDLEVVYQSIKEGSKAIDVMDSNFPLYCKYRNGIRDAIAIHTKRLSKEFRKLDVTLIHGPTETGKTRFAVQNAGDDYFKIHASDMKWWDGYNGEKTLIIDEYNNDVTITKMLETLDGYQQRLPVKGSYTYAAWTKVFITTNLPPDWIHSNAKERHRAALFRRITSIKHFEK